MLVGEVRKFCWESEIDWLVGEVKYVGWLEK